MSLVHPLRQGLVSKTKPVIATPTYISTTSVASLLLVGTETGVKDLSKNNWPINISSGITTTTSVTKNLPITMDWGNTAYATLTGSSGSSEFAFGTGDYTIESWINFKESNRNCMLIASLRFGGSTGFGHQIATGRIDSYLSSGGSEYTVSPALSTSTWHHIALARKDGIMSWYINGTRMRTLSQTASVNVPYIVSLASDDNGPARDTYIYCSELRVVKGAALYQGDTYQVPTTALTTSSLQIQVLSTSSNYGVNQIV